MKYLQPTFTLPTCDDPSKMTACPACVYGEQIHSDDCPVFSAHVVAVLQKRLTNALVECELYHLGMRAEDPGHSQ